MLPVLLAAAAVAAVPVHNVQNVTIYSSFDTMGVAVSGGRLLFGGGKLVEPKLTALFDTKLLTWKLAGYISADRASMAATATADGTMALFAGGEGFNKTKFATVDRFDATTDTWSTLPNLTQARSFLSATTVKDPASGREWSLFAGGEIVAGVTGSDSARVDIFDHKNGIWAKGGDLLVTPRKKLAAASALGLAVFGGGYTSGQKNTTTRGYDATVDIFNSTSGVWSTAKLSQPRQYITAAATVDKILFGGGFCSPCTGQNGTSRSDVVDIFDIKSNTWTSHQLSQRRSNLAACAVGGRYVLFGGGTSDINVTSAEQSLQQQQRKSSLEAGSGGGPLVRTTAVDIYDGKLNKWSTAKLGQGETFIAFSNVTLLHFLVLTKVVAFTFILGRCCLGAAGDETTAVFLGGGSGTVADIFRFE
jgi:hypothetical protein